MFGALIKEDARLRKEEDGRRTVVVSIMPCTAKKAEIKRPEHFDEDGQIVDYVLTTSEIADMITMAGINLAKITPEALDMPFGMSSGAGAIFGATGGVTEAVLRCLSNDSSASNLEAISFSGVRGVDGVKEASMELAGKQVKIAVVNGLINAQRLLDKMEAGEVYYDFVEVMACKHGCVGGGGQPVALGAEPKLERQEGLYRFDSLSQIKLSNQNPVVQDVYQGILKGKEHKLLHNEKH